MGQVGYPGGEPDRITSGAIPLSRPAKTAADYAAIAVAPVLIFLMICSLANFVMLIFYHGPFPERVAYITFMFTMGAVASARISIEQSRSYALGYVITLGAVTFLVMMQFVGAPLFSAGILLLIGYLADRIVHDCTLIDDEVDASGVGLIDSGRLFATESLKQTTSDDDPPPSDPPAADSPSAKSRTRVKHQPGRTVMYLALAALPLFGLGQFMMRTDGDSWTRAQTFLAVYLFSALSLMVVTSFLGLRRYLRQRRVDMPTNVSIGWLAGGLVMIALILVVAYLLPLPGKTIAQARLPDWLGDVEDFSASRLGWGNESADQQLRDTPTAPQRPDQPAPEDSPVVAKEGAKAGDAGTGNRDDGPAGDQSGGDQSGGESGESESESSSGSEQSSDSQQSSSSSESDQNQSQASRSEQPQSEMSESERSDSQPRESESDKSESNKSRDEAESSDPKSDDEQPADQQSDQPPEADEEAQSPVPPPQSQSPGLLSGLTTLVKVVLFLVLFGIVAAFLYFNRDAIRQWWLGLFGDPEPEEAEKAALSKAVATVKPPRPFSSFRNPIGMESDPQRVIVITFQAFDAWSREHGWARRDDETPSEFIRRVAGNIGS
ncbi:MAG: hypothetical protein AAGA03_08755, partial [Planctomycetota bacterium]